MTEFVREAENGSDAWQLLVAQGGLDPDRHDVELVASVAARLGVEPSTLPGALSDRSAEEVVRVFLDEVQPFVSMWTDLLRLFEQAQATSGASTLQIKYTFGEGQPDVSFDIDHFRRDLAVTRKVVARHWFTDDNLGGGWRVNQALDRLIGGARGSSPARAELDELRERTRSNEWPESLPPRPDLDGAGPPLVDLLGEVRDLAERFLAGLRQVSVGYEELGVAGRGADVAGFDDASLQAVWHLESDFWLEDLTVVAKEALQHWKPPGDESAIDDLGQALEPFRNAERNAEWISAVESFLALPLWRFRYELYSNWVATLVIEALGDRMPHVHSNDGVLEFSFSGTHLATFDRFEPRLHLWTEFRSGLDDPVGAGRTANVQPDMVLRLDPLSTIRVPLAVECKHYLRPNNKSFAHALMDYSRAHPSAHVVLVDHGRVNESTVHKHVDDDVVSRTSVVSELRPDRPDALKNFRRRVRDAVAGFESEPASSIAAVTDRSGPCTDGTTVTLSWAAPPGDLDLRVDLCSDGDTTRVSYSNRGRVDSFPYCSLDDDVTDGSAPERVTIHRMVPFRYNVSVDVFSSDSPAPGATVTLTSGSFECELKWPNSLQGGTWNVCSIDGTTGRVSLLQQVVRGAATETPEVASLRSEEKTWR